MFRGFSPIRTANPDLNRVQDALAAALNPLAEAIPSFADAEEPAGPCDGSNTTFRLQRMPNPAESLVVVVANETSGVGGVLVQGVAYTLRRHASGGAEVTMTSAPANTTTIRCWYRF